MFRSRFFYLCDDNTQHPLCFVITGKCTEHLFQQSYMQSESAILTPFIVREMTREVKTLKSRHSDRGPLYPHSGAEAQQLFASPNELFSPLQGSRQTCRQTHCNSLKRWVGQRFSAERRP